MTTESKAQWYWLVGGGPMQLRALRYLKEKDFNIILSDGNRDCPGRALADLFFELDIHDLDSHLKLLNGPLLEVKAQITGVSCIATDSHQTVAGISETLKLSGISRELSTLIGDKVKLRESLTKVGVFQPVYIEFSKSENLEKVLDEVKSRFSTNSDLIIKPLGWSASKGIKVLQLNSISTKDLLDAIEVSRDGVAVIEELLEPDGKLASESSIETLVQGGKVKYLNIVDRIFADDLNHFSGEGIPSTLNIGVEFGHINPSSRSKSEIDLVLGDLQKLADHLTATRKYDGETFILKADILFSKKGPVILEATPRTSGGWDSSYTSPARGLKIQELAIEISLGNQVVLNDFVSNSQEFIAVVTDVSEESVNCLGRTFYAGELSENPQLAVSSALASKEKGIFL
jgi:hypothetical protein